MFNYDFTFYFIPYETHVLSPKKQKIQQKLR